MGLFCCASSRKSKKRPEEQNQRPPIAPTSLGSAQGSRPAQGLRKPGETAPPDRLSQSEENGGFDMRDPRPNDYLYFGGPDDHRTVPSGIVTPGPAKHPTSAASPNRTQPSPATDASGFPNSSMSSIQMGYQNLTYGGSLQYDYSGTHPLSGVNGGYGH